MALSPHPDSPDYAQQKKDKAANPERWQGNWDGFKTPEQRANAQKKRVADNKSKQKEL